MSDDAHRVEASSSRLTIADGIGWVRRGDGLLYTALPCEYLAEIGRFRTVLQDTAEWMKGRMPCTSGKCCEELRERIAAIDELLADDHRSTP